jgi:hypothetical protein
MISSGIVFIPRLLAAIMIFIIGKLIANYVVDIVGSIIKALNLKSAVNSFELGVSLSDEVEAGMIRTISLIAKYSVIYLSLIIALQIIGLNEVASVLSRLVNVLPIGISALFILLIGVILAGFIESLVKKALITFDPATARLGGKTASYTVVSFFGLMSLAELGLAANFINTLFIGLVGAISLAFGLSIGLGSKDLVHDVLQNWYIQRKSVKKNSLVAKSKAK